MKKLGGFQFILGIVIGAVLFGGTAAYAVSVMAQPKTASVIIDGKTVDLKGYVIEDTHYFQLRSLDSALKSSGKDFSVVWDDANNQIIIDTSRGYDPGETPTAQAQSQGNADGTEEMRAEIIRLTNAQRVKAGLPELEGLPALTDSAQAKAQDFVNNRYFGHISPVYGTSGDMIKTYIPSVKSVGENLASRISTPEETVAGWMDSSGHRSNILNAKYTHTGVGITKNSSGGYNWVQHFASF